MPMSQDGEAPAIEVRGLTKEFTVTSRRPGVAGAVRSLLAPVRSRVVAVDDVSFAVRRGELVAMLGPNGAGKSTTVKLIAGILVPTAGDVSVAGLVPHRARRRNAYNIGVMFGQRSQLWWDLPGRESLDILQAIFDLDDATYTRRLREFDAMLELSSFWRTPVRHLSLGQRTRLDLAAALLHDPPIVILDEPTVGMDVVAREQVREFLRDRVARHGAAVLLTTHDMTEVAHLAERVLLINHSELIFDGPLAELRAAYGGTWRITVTLSAPVPQPPPIDGLRVASRDARRICFVADRCSAVPIRESLRRIITEFPVVNVAVAEDDIEDVMRAAYTAAPPGASRG